MSTSININKVLGSTSGTSITIGNVLSPPVNTVAPVVSGTTTLGSVLTTTNGTWSNSPTSYTYQWKRGATNIGTNTNTYTLVIADSLASITCVVTAINAAGSSIPATSNTITAGNYAPVNTVAPVISGSTPVGSTLTTTNGTWTNSPTFAYQWYRGATLITSATAATYVTVTADRGLAVTCQVTGTNPAGSANATSNTITVDNLFTSTWTTTVTFQSIVLPYYSGGTYSGTIDWGDGSPTSVNSVANAQHTYASAGTYTVVIDGDCTGWSFGAFGVGTPTLLTSVVHFGQLKLGVTYQKNFAGCTNLNLSSVSDTLNLTGVTSLEFLFQNCTSLTTINNINSWNTSAITNMTQIFDSCINFNQPLSFDTSAVTNMSRMFQNCDIFNSALNFNTISVTTMSRMFLNTLAFNQPLNFNTSAVTTMLSMFSFATAFNSPLTFTSTALVTSMSSMFSNAHAFNQPINFNTISVTSMASMFNNATAFNQNLGSLNVANVTSFTSFMASKTPATFSTTNLDAIYNGWVTVQSSRTISFGTAKYSAAGVAGRAYLTGTKLWTITDGGL